MAEVVFLGDDFTGASDTLATYARKGWPARLVLNPSGATDGLAALGLATDLRARPPKAAQAEIAHLWPRIAKADPRVLHLKVCSTFDSAPHTGSIGAVALDLIDRFKPDVIAVIGGQPSLGRYCIFGNLFATGPDNMVHRIDRHSVMGHHPVTPMTEADLRQHLAAQGLTGLDLVPFTDLGNTAALARRVGHGPVLIDVATPQDQRLIADALRVAGGRQLLIGASSVAEILTATSDRTDQPSIMAPPASDNLLVFAGSRSANTRTQVQNARTLRKLPLTPEALHTDHLINEAAQLLKSGTPVLVHLCPDISYGLAPDALADASANFVATVIQRSNVGHLGLAGGDTSSRISARLGFDSLDFERSFSAGACICVARHRDARLDRMRVMLKGGQMGQPDLFDAFAERAPVSP
ncbi:MULTISPECIES: four-carbon acid sugar kinase family protein [Roseobacteraceae]|uniref:Hrp-dependent type III effector protein n=1 Tax=Pseudosulfitobacter pseudonitzschiae TaxID=1402135 RepID=A0A221K7T1_9RHOB|nr:MULTISPECIES: four-carbon acid sugar kinase family protein [Roseobacteraceae]ASM74907.1 Hrp-dependent type III effector protein [Pseudosulfitobacter pseudonitzschiae]